MRRIQGLHHGGDYNPSQWLDNYPDIVEKDFQLMQESHTNTFSFSIFGWGKLEPEEGNFDFEWMDRIMDRMAKEGNCVSFATPSGAKPSWLSKKYPETRKVNPNLQRMHFGHRHNHCWTSPIYREKVTEINSRLAERYKDNPALWIWHLSNEYGGDPIGSACYCNLCQEKFRIWLKNKYSTLDVLNHAWWAHFWSHTFTDWGEIEAPHSMNLAESIHGLMLDWKRFTTYNAVDFMKVEIDAVKKYTPNIPVTTNFMGTFEPLNYWQFAKELDLVSWDSYPQWHVTGEGTTLQEYDIDLSHQIAFQHDLMRSYKKKSWILMESTPSATNWTPITKNKRQGMHKLSSLQAVAHGADGVLYFQFRKGRGGSEKFHGAIVDHVGHIHTRVGREIKDTGQLLEKLGDLYEAHTNAEIAIIQDWENRWAYETAQGPRNDKQVDYVDECIRCYVPFRNNQMAVDIICTESSFENYKVIVAPMLYMLSKDTADRLRLFVNSGGTLIFTFWSGIVNESDLCHLNGFPGYVRDVFGIWNEEIDALALHEKRALDVDIPNFNIKGQFKCSLLWEHIHLEGARSIAVFKEDLFEGRPAITVNNFGKGKAYYIAGRMDNELLERLLPAVAKESGVKPVIDVELPHGVFVNYREKEGVRYYIWQNFTTTSCLITLPIPHINVENNQEKKEIHLEIYGVAVTKDIHPYQ